MVQTQKSQTNILRKIPDGIFILDGATGTELERKGEDCSMENGIWSANALINVPNSVKEVHKSYLEAGAHAITTCTFRTHKRSLAKAKMGDRASELTHLAIKLACEARDQVNPNALVLGGVTTLEDCYRPDQAPDFETCKLEHRQIMSQMLEAGVDMILIETMAAAHEAVAAAEVAEELAPGRWGISFCLSTDGSIGKCQDGTPLKDVIGKLARGIIDLKIEAFFKIL